MISQLLGKSWVNRTMIWLVQLLIFACCGVVAALLRFDLTIPASHLIYVEYGVPIWVVVKATIFRWRRLDRGWWRFVSIHDVVEILIGNVIASIVSAIAILLISPRGFPRSLYFIDFLLCFVATTGIRFFRRILTEFAARRATDGQSQRVLIYGAGMAGVTLLREIRSNNRLHFNVVGFIDDNTRKKGVSIHGVRVLGHGPALVSLVTDLKIELVLIALPSATGADMTSILRSCQEAGVRCRTIPALAEIIEGRGLATQIRDVAVEDLLGRSPVQLEEHEITAKLRDAVIMVTGAAGSIGSELCRQIARFYPKAIVGYDIAETALFYLEREMRASFAGVDFYPEIGNIQSRKRLSETLARYRPSIVYHAAAYKHVPMMEANVVEAVENNVFGTYQVALAAAEYDVEEFVMISSDKAVRPTNVMGATKRLAELLVNSLQDGGTKYVSVRFGNVLGSNGSVIPIFKSQIASGGPVTVTHPEMRRYFMTIPEAAQLVLQASTMGQGGEIFVLDMGEPVKIIDLATNLILLSGLRPEEDVKIEYTGMRPGEKLFEELSAGDEDTAATRHPKINIFVGKNICRQEMLDVLDTVRTLCEERDIQALILTIKEIVPDYNPSLQVLRQITADQAKFAAAVT